MALSRKILFKRNFCCKPSPPKFDVYFYGAVLQRDKTNLIYGLGCGDLKFYCDGKQYEVKHNGRYFNVLLPPMSAGGPHVLEVRDREFHDIAEVYFGDVFLLAGQSNMEWTSRQCSACKQVAEEIEKANDSLLRLYNVHCDYCPEERDELKENVRWTSAAPETVTDFSCLGYLFGRYYKQKANVPVGLVATAVGGTALTFWQNCGVQSTLIKRGVEIFTDAAQPIFTPSIGYNALINPLTANSYKAVLWYQGESNTENAAHYISYYNQLTALIKSWRKEFDDSSLVFVLFQLARFENNQRGFSEVNFQINRVSAEVENCYAVTSHDLGEFHNIHPNDKVTPAKRAVDVFFDGAHAMKLKRAKKTAEGLLLTFDNVYDGIVVKGKLNGLSVSQDGINYRRVERYEVGRDSILLFDENVCFVRYGFDCITDELTEADVSLMASLYNSLGMPLDLFSIKVN